MNKSELSVFEELTLELKPLSPMDVEKVGYRNCVDITVGGNSTFIISDGTISHNSALGGLSPVLGREETGYYTLKGKPLNAYSATQQKFAQNKELSELYSIIKNEVTTEEMPDGEFYEITDTQTGKKYIVSENDEFFIDGVKVDISDI